MAIRIGLNGQSAGGDKVDLFGRIRRRFFRAIFRTTNVPTAIAIAVILGAAFFAEAQNHEIFRQELRAQVRARIELIRAKLEGNVSGNIQLVRGLVATIATEPDMNQDRFARLASALPHDQSQIRSVAAAPDLVVSLIYPLAGNEKALGLDYRENAAQREAAFRARDTGELVLAGPVELVQGGTAFIGRFPVYTKRANGGFWGIVSVVIDADRLYRESGLMERGMPIDVAIARLDGPAGQDTPFFGEPSVLDQDPEYADVLLPSVTWRIAAVPKGGWDVPPDNRWLLRAVVLLCGALIVIPMLVTARLVEERQRHIRELRRRETELKRLSRRLGLALETSQVGVWDFDMARDELVWDDRMNELYGLPVDDGPRTYADWRNALHPEDLERAERDFDEAIGVTGRYYSEFRVRLPDGVIRHIRAIGAIYEGAEGSSKIVGVNWDVSADVERNEDLRRTKNLMEARHAELMVAKARIEHTALHDALTGLPNRRYLDQKLELRARREDRAERTALLHIDLDRFKQINDTLGHAAGDAMLVHAASVLKSNVRASDFLARVGGDEFVVMCLLDGDDADANHRYLSELANRIVRKMGEPVMYEGHECRFGVSVGISIDSGAGSDPRSLLVDADIALYRAKSRGRNQHQFFNEALQAEIVSTKRVADEILNGLEQGQFIVHYQPQFDARSLEVAGVEALVRWNHPTEGVLGPDRFLKIAEELSVVPTIDRMVLERSLADFEKWNRAGLRVPRIAVNVSARRLGDEELIRSLRSLNIRRGTVSFELVESIFLDDNDELIGWNVEQIKELGIDVEIDDFGTGYASIVSLLKLRPRRLKIDRQLVMPITLSTAQTNLVQSIIEIGRSLGIEVIAEGVETMEHARILRELGCQELQGYAFARPMSAADFEAFILARRGRAAG
ncbi:bifunctional diguanylate cyclase/phosphodiesterase [Mesorhizobium sp. L-8-3]|uniref:bifunctional diguanylate cyclase/phosphodiesterase n=1 Tax=Mesorhizobium sp. L-8-3 TaxID=2744522 RepID=UPI0019267C48|nr:EAL domain-containing protein [Mesorhizobium sp. L-8-3]BCH25832.1 diguanylate cyclase [Mesorhizobium sp. L-8-3]